MTFFTPQLSETWGAAYIQLITALLIFFVGLPLLLSQLSLPEDIRRIYFQYQKKFWFLSIILMSILSALLLLWYFHPCPGKVQTSWVSIVISILISIMLFSLIIIYIKLSNHGRDALINVISKKCQPANIYSSAFKDLVYLGECGNPGMEKSLVIHKINEFIDKINQNNTYSLQMFDNIIDDLKKIVFNGFRQGNEDNFKAVFQVLQKIQDSCIKEEPNQNLI
jgi:hypothetical protein